jgi:peptide/nickel transport system ATP-binding protein
MTRRTVPALEQKSPRSVRELKHSPLLRVSRLRVTIATPDGPITPVDGIDLSVARGETVAIVGESGCGKTITAHAIAGLFTSPGFTVAGEISLGGVDLLTLPPSEIRKYRGKNIAMVFQEPMTALNPLMPVGEQVAEPLRVHFGLSRTEAKRKSLELFDLVHIPDSTRRFGSYPHEMSGGMQQRAMIAIAIACRPQLLIADEPTTGLDVTIQAQILNLLKELQDTIGMAIILITHDLGVVAEEADRVAVMYTGRIVEEANVFDLFDRPAHPYTLGLLRSMPRHDAQERASRLNQIKGAVPPLSALPPGCTFADRCGFATELCHKQVPPLEEKATGRRAACWHSDVVVGT